MGALYQEQGCRDAGLLPLAVISSIQNMLELTRCPEVVHIRSI
jgi:hypothetical protein